MKGSPAGGPFVVCVGAKKSTSTGPIVDQYWLIFPSSEEDNLPQQKRCGEEVK